MSKYQNHTHSNKRLPSVQKLPYAQRQWLLMQDKPQAVLMMAIMEYRRREAEKRNNKKEQTNVKKS